jgi:hypothetical protein
MPPPSSGPKNNPILYCPPASAVCLHGLIFDHEDGIDKFLWNVDLPPKYCNLEPRTLRYCHVHECNCRRGFGLIIVPSLISTLYNSFPDSRVCTSSCLVTASNNDCSSASGFKSALNGGSLSNACLFHNWLAAILHQSRSLHFTACQLSTPATPLILLFTVWLSSNLGPCL